MIPPSTAQWQIAEQKCAAEATRLFDLGRRLVEALTGQPTTALSATQGRNTNEVHISSNGRVYLVREQGVADWNYRVTVLFLRQGGAS